MSNVKFTQLPDLAQGSITGTTIVPVVEGGVNYTVTTANLQSYVNSTTGNITGGNILTGGVVSATGNVTGSNLNTSGIVSATGNITGSYFLGNGSQLSGLPATYSDSNVATFLSAFGANTISSTGNITTTANIAGSYVLGNGSQLTGLPANYGNANVTSLMAAFGSNVISSTGNITTTANIAGGYVLGNGSLLTGLGATYSNSNVTALLAAFGSNTISSTGNITTTANVAGGFFLGNGSQLTGITATSSYGNANVATLLAGFGSNSISTTGNVTATNFVGNGAALTGIVASAGTFIANGGTYANAVTANGLLKLVAANTASGFDGAQITVQDNGNGGNIVINAALGTGGGYIILSGTSRFNALTSTTGAIVMSGGQIDANTVVTSTVTASSLLRVPTFTIAAKPASGQAGAIISITNSPTQAGKMAYWSTTSSSWRYIADDTAV
jgi:hypothetical protein